VPIKEEKPKKSKKVSDAITEEPVTQVPAVTEEEPVKEKKTKKSKKASEEPVTQVLAEEPVPIKEKKTKKSKKASEEPVTEEPVTQVPTEEPVPIKEKKTKKSKKASEEPVTEKPVTQVPTEEPVTQVLPTEEPIKEKKTKKSKKASDSLALVVGEEDATHITDVVSPLDFDSTDNDLQSESYDQTILQEFFVNDVLFYFDPSKRIWFDSLLSPISDPTI
jgi:hypothetical protein